MFCSRLLALAVHLPLGSSLLLFRCLVGQKGMVQEPARLWGQDGSNQARPGTDARHTRSQPSDCLCALPENWGPGTFCLYWGTSALPSASKPGLSQVGRGEEELWAPAGVGLQLVLALSWGLSGGLRWKPLGRSQVPATLHAPFRVSGTESAGLDPSPTSSVPPGLPLQVEPPTSSPGWWRISEYMGEG